jgi:ABC-type lipopolysaccharide export system ATPase subunit
VSLLQAIKLRKTFSGRLVVNDVSFVVNPSEIVGLLGRNGAGKTTSFRMTIGMIDPDPGPDSGRCALQRQRCLESADVSAGEAGDGLSVAGAEHASRG